MGLSLRETVVWRVLANAAQGHYSAAQALWRQLCCSSMPPAVCTTQCSATCKLPHTAARVFSLVLLVTSQERSTEPSRFSVLSSPHEQYKLKHRMAVLLSMSAVCMACHSGLHSSKPGSAHASVMHDVTTQVGSEPASTIHF